MYSLWHIPFTPKNIGDYDQNKDGVLMMKELKCGMMVDKNKNGKIDANEVLHCILIGWCLDDDEDLKT